MRVLITGGHFAPAQAVIGELKKRGATIAVAGRRHPFEGDLSESYEYAVVKRENIDFFEVKAGRFQRKFTSYSVASLLKTPAGYINAIGIIREYKPDVVLTFGGYIGLPISFAARTLGIPVVLHEQTLGAGLASRMISKIAAKVFVAFESSAGFFQAGKTQVVGNPIRPEIFEIEDKFSIPVADKKVIYITGGSAGSHFINSQIAKILPELCREFIVIHQTGDNKFGDYEDLSKIADSLPDEIKKNYIIRKFVSEKEIGFIYSVADLVIARSGINTVCELLAMEKISILIPLPSGQINEQLSNAKLVVQKGVGEILPQEHATGKALTEMVHKIFDNFKDYKKNTAEAKKIVTLGAAAKIADILEKYYG